jgi:hypothetical protein
MTLKAIAYVRTYKLNDSPIRKPAQIPDEMKEWINSRYRAQMDRLHYYDLAPEKVQLGVHAINVQRAVLFHPKLRAADGSMCFGMTPWRRSPDSHPVNGRTPRASGGPNSALSAGTTPRTSTPSQSMASSTWTVSCSTAGSVSVFAPCTVR